MDKIVRPLCITKGSYIKSQAHLKKNQGFKDFASRRVVWQKLKQGNEQLFV